MSVHRVARAGAGLLGMLIPVLVAVLLWVYGAPRAQGVSLGGGRAVMMPESGRAGGAQLLMLLLLLTAAVVCGVLVLWRRHPALRRPSGVPLLVAAPALAAALAATVAPVIAGWLVPPDPATPAGQVVSLAPGVGALFSGPVVAGWAGPDWRSLPAGAGWLVSGLTVAALTVAALAHLSAADPWTGDPDPAEPTGADPGEVRA